MTARISDLLLITISIPPRQIEQVLDALARLPHAINPDLRYEEWQTHIHFPAYRSWVDELHEMLAREGFVSARLRYTPVLDAMHGSNSHDQFRKMPHPCAP